MCKRIFYSISICCLFVFCISCSLDTSRTKNKTFQTNSSNSNIKLRFNSDGTFKIVQFTDIHWTNGTDKCDETLRILGSVLDKEKPDLVVFTGDIAVSDNQKQAFDTVSKLVVDRKIPWTMVIGNHDHEHDMKRKDIIPYLQQKPLFLGVNGPDDVYGYGNYELSVLSSKDNSNAAQLYFFDSNSYVENKVNGYYDWIHFSQIQWYRQLSEDLRIENKGKLLPSLAFFHIPLPEYDELYNSGNIIGEKNEAVCSPKVNSGLFSSFIDMKDVMGMFVGHDHDNNYIGVLRNIALAYGAVSGLDAYGKFDRGGRVIELFEGERKFKTWIRTNKGVNYIYHYPDNNLYPTDSTVFLPAVELNNPAKGVHYNYYEKHFVSAKEIDSQKPGKNGVLTNISLDPAEVKEHYGFEFTTYVNIPQKAMYELKTASDDGVIVYLNDSIVIDNDGSHSEQEKSAFVGLDKGFHRLRILYFNGIGGGKLNIGISSLEKHFKTIPDSWLYTN